MMTKGKYRVIRLLIAIFFVGSGLLAAFGPRAVPSVLACSCMMPGTPNEAYDEAKFVFSGRVTSISGGSGLLASLLDVIGLGGPERYDRDVIIEVTDSWKGVHSTTVTVRTGLGGGDCGYNFDEGSDYLVYGYGSIEDISTDICSRTKSIVASSAADDFAFLAGKPTLTLSNSASENGVSPWLIVLVGAIGGGLIAILYFRRRNESGAAD